MKSNFFDVEIEQFEIQKLRENLYSVIFRPNTRFLPSKYEILISHTSRFFDLAEKVESHPIINWWDMSYLAYICQKYDGNYLT